MWRRRNTNCPRGAWRSRTRWMIRLVADCRLCIGWNGHLDHDLAEKFTISIEDLNAVIAAVRYIDIVLGINCNAVRSIELTWPVPWLAPRFQPVALLVYLCDSGIDIAVANVGVALGIPCHIGYLSEQSILGRQRWLHLL